MKQIRLARQSLREGDHSINTRVALAGMVLLLVAACSQPPTPIPQFVADEEYGVYRDLLLENEEMWNIPAGIENVVFFDQTFVRHDADSVRSILGGKDGFSEELITNYLLANSRSYPLEAKFDLGKPVMLVPEEAIKGLVQGLEYAQQCYDAVQAVYPAPEYGGWYYVSRVGFDARMRTALLYIEKSLCGGAGNFLALAKESGVWKIKGWAIGLQSDMRLDMPPQTPQPVSDLDAALIVTPTLQTLPAGSSAQFGLAIAPPCQTHPNAFGVDQLPAGWTAEFLGSSIPCKETLVLNTPGAASPGRYSIRITAAPETTLPAWTELGVEILPCVEFQTGEFSRAMHENLVTSITAGKPAIEHGLLVPLQVCGAEPGRRLLVTLTEVISETGSRMASPPRFYLYRSLVWPEPSSIVAHGAPGTLNVGLPRTENEGWQLEAEVTPGLYLLVFERDYYGSSTDRETIPASLTYRLEALP